jgi:hypothetical protein
MAGSVHVPWYATLFRGDAFEQALGQIAPLALRYGATSWGIHRSRDDRYRFLQISAFESKLDWERYWYGDDFATWRQEYSGFYQVPVLYVWHDLVAGGALDPAANGGVSPAPAAPS